MLPWVSDKVEIKRMHCLRTGDLSEEFVVEIEDRKGEIESWFRVFAMDSSSVAAAECVSRSESLLRQVRTRCLKSGGDLGVCLASGIVEVSEVVYSDSGGGAAAALVLKYQMLFTVTVVVVVVCL
ncbi:hypothetical protein Hanom_Chr08g00735681 [Helianthus anomalus]